MSLLDIIGGAVHNVVGAIGDILNGPENNKPKEIVLAPGEKIEGVKTPTVPTTIDEQLNNFKEDLNKLVGMTNGAVGGTSGNGGAIIVPSSPAPPTYTTPTPVGSTNTVQMGKDNLDAIKTSVVVGQMGAEIPALIGDILNGGGSEKATEAQARRDAIQIAKNDGKPIADNLAGGAGSVVTNIAKDAAGNVITDVAKNAAGGTVVDVIKEALKNVGIIDDSVLASIVPAIATYLGQNAQIGASKEAAQIQADFNQKALDEEKRQFDTIQTNSKPWLDAGTSALTRLNAMTTNPSTFSMADFQADPGYDFRLSEGVKALDRSAAARGGLLSGATLKGTQQYGQNLASDEYQNAFNRYTSQRTSQMNALQSLAGVGQTATQQLNQAGQNYANSAGNLLAGTGNALAQNATNIGNINASSYQGYNGALNAALNRNQSNSLLQKLLS